MKAYRSIHYTVMVFPFSRLPWGEVLNSAWVRDTGAQMHASAKRIWAPRGVTPSAPTLRHFIVPLKERTLECLAGNVTLIKCVESFDKAYVYVQARQSEH